MMRLAAEFEMVAAEEVAAAEGDLTPATRADLASEQQSVAAHAVQQRLRTAALASRNSINAELAQADPDVSVLAVLRLAADEEQQMSSLARLLQPGLDSTLQNDLGVGGMVVSKDHYTSVNASASAQWLPCASAVTVRSLFRT